MLTQIRKNERNQSERRAHDRREADFEFNSPEWIEEAKKNYIAWPKTDRRQLIRRDGERRYDTQKQQEYGRFNADYSSDLLTNEERLYFNQLFMNEAKK